MAGPAVIQYLSKRDFEAFRTLVRQYSHDVLSTAANMAVGAQVLIKLVQKRAGTTLADPRQAPDVLPFLEALLRYAMELPRASREYIWGDPDEHHLHLDDLRERWNPYDVPTWDRFHADYVAFMQGQLRDLQAMIDELEAWTKAGGLAPPEQSRDFRQTVGGIRRGLDSARSVLEDPAVFEERVAEMLRKDLKEARGSEEDAEA